MNRIFSEFFLCRMKMFDTTYSRLTFQASIMRCTCSIYGSDKCQIFILAYLQGVFGEKKKEHTNVHLQFPEQQAALDKSEVLCTSCSAAVELGASLFTHKRSFILKVFISVTLWQPRRRLQGNNGESSLSWTAVNFTLRDFYLLFSFCAQASSIHIYI